MNTQEDIRYKYRSDAERFTYLLSPCAFSTERFTSAWNLRASGREDAVLELGYPRDDALAAPGPDAVSKAKERLGLSGEKRKLILYAPTWRDDQYDADVGYTYDINMDFSTLREELGDSYAILYRAHYLVHDDLDTGAFAGFVYDVSDADDINDIYLASDMLITDYSSVFFDYAILRRPIIFYMYDLEKYESMLRGFYLGLDELPGPVVTSGSELAACIRSTGENWEPDEKYREFNQRINCLNDGKAAERFVNRVFCAGGHLR